MRVNTEKRQQLQEFLNGFNSSYASNTLSIGEDTKIGALVRLTTCRAALAVEARGFAMFGGRRIYITMAGGVEDANVQRFLDSFNPR